MLGSFIKRTSVALGCFLTLAPKCLSPPCINEQGRVAAHRDHRVEREGARRMKKVKRERERKVEKQRIRGSCQRSCSESSEGVFLSSWIAGLEGRCLEVVAGHQRRDCSEPGTRHRIQKCDLYSGKDACHRHCTRFARSRSNGCIQCWRDDVTIERGQSEAKGGEMAKKDGEDGMDCGMAGATTRPWMRPITS